MIFWVVNLCGALAEPATSPRAYRAAHVWNESEALGRALGAVAWFTAELENAKSVRIKTGRARRRGYDVDGPWAPANCPTDDPRRGGG